MFEDRTYEKLMEETLAMAPAGIDTRQGSIFYDAIAAIINKIAKLYTDLDAVSRAVFLTTAYDEYLDLKSSEFALTRQSATQAQYEFVHTGTTPRTGWRFFHQTSGYYFRLLESEENGLYLEAETPGTECNYIESGDVAVPVDTVNGMTSASFGRILTYGTDPEDDESLRTRVEEKIAGPAENGNKQHYKTWCATPSA